MTPQSRLRTPDRLTAPNPFAGGGVAIVGDDFTNRETERAELVRGLQTPRGHTIVSGPRRIGKTSILLAVRDELAHAGVPVIYVDLWTASTIEDMTTRLAQAATAVLGRRWQDIVTTIGQRLKLSFEVSETSSGAMLPVPKLEFRDAPLTVQRERLVDALDLLEQMAAKHKTHLGVIIDEFQEIERLGSDGEQSPRRAGGAAARGGRGRDTSVSAMRQVRAAIQMHRHVTYLFAGSDRRLIARLHDEDGGALHNLGRKYDIGPIEPGHFARWIESGFDAMGIAGAGADIGAQIIAVAGPRTRDVRTLAESVAELARATGVVTEPMLGDGMRAVVRQRRPSYEADWKLLTKGQQNVLRAVAAEGSGLTRAEVRRRFGLGEASTVVKAIDALVDRAILVRDENAVRFDDPFHRAWVIVSSLPDVGVQLPITHVAGTSKI